MELKSVCGKTILVSDEDGAELAQYEWHVHEKTGYGYRVIEYTARRGKLRRKREYLHNKLLPRKRGFVVDHRYGNRLDNRACVERCGRCDECMIRYLTYRDNASNRKKTRGASKFIGVRPIGDGRFRASISYNHGKRLELGTFTSEVDASIARDHMAARLSEHYRLNWPHGHPDYDRVVESLDQHGFHRTGHADRPSKSGYRGVKFDRSKSRWAAYIGFAGKRYLLGRRRDSRDCAILYDSASRILHGEDAALNLPDEPPNEGAVAKAHQILRKHPNYEPRRRCAPKIVSDAERPAAPQFIGVSRNGPSRYQAVITIEKRRIYLGGRFKTAAEAAREYNKMAKPLGRRLNDVPAES